MLPINSGWQPVTWGEYGEQVSLVTHALGALGLGCHDNVGILSANCVEWIYAGIGAMSARTILVPIFHASMPDQLAYTVRHADLRLLFVGGQSDVDTLFAGEQAYPELKTIVSFGDDIITPQPDIAVFSMQEFYARGREYRNHHPYKLDQLISSVDLDDIAYMIYTSGTTGQPKGVPLSYRNLAVSTNDWVAINGALVQPYSDDIHWLPNSHIFGWGAVGLGNLLGFRSYLGTPLNVLELLPIVRPHLFMSVPAYYEKLYSLATQSSTNPKQQFETLKKITGGRIQFCLSGGAGLKREIKEFFLDAGLLITEGYGLSECSPTLTMNRPRDFNFDSVGKPYPSVQLRLAADGEIEAKGPVVFKGYYKDPEATREVFTEDGWFKTGDVGRWLNDDFLQIIDRKKDILVTSGGKNIAPQYIEQMFADNPYIDHLVVYGDGHKYLVALITVNLEMIESYLATEGVAENTTESPTEHPVVKALIQEQVDLINQRLASFQTIKKFYMAPEALSPQNGLLTSGLKLRRRAVYEKYLPNLEKLYIADPKETDN